MIDALKKITGLRLKEAMEVLNKYPKYRYMFNITKAPRQDEKRVTEEFRVLKVTEIDNGLISILLCAEQ